MPLLERATGCGEAQRMIQFKEQVTDADGEVAYGPERKPGVSNLLAILAACTEQEPDALARQFGRHGDLSPNTPKIFGLIGAAEMRRPLELGL